MAAIKLFNCELIDMTANLGFGGQESSINLKLVECGGASYNGSLGCVYTVNIGGFDISVFKFIFRGTPKPHNDKQAIC